MCDIFAMHDMKMFVNWIIDDSLTIYIKEKHMHQCNLKHHISRIETLLLLVLLILTCVPVANAAESGNCGESLQWNYNEGVLTITGTGPMNNYSEEVPAPWTPYSENITCLILPEGLTHVGNYAFAQCSALELVQLPNSVVSIGKSGFFACTSMKFLTLSNSLQTIEENAFERCLSITAVHLPNSLQSLGYMAFWRCESLLAVTIPESVISLDMAVFAHCKSLIQADVRAPIKELPQWLFFGCTNLASVNLPETLTGVDEYAFHGCGELSTVRYPGSQENSQKITEDIKKYMDALPNFDVSSSISDTTTHISFTETNNGLTTLTTTVAQKNNTTVGTVINQIFPPESLKSESCQAEITATVEDDTGWETVIEETERALDRYANQLEEEDTISVTVNVPNGSAIDSELLSYLAEQPVTLTVQTIGGSSWTIDCTELTTDGLTGSYDLSYTLTKPESQWIEELGGAETYHLQFENTQQINAELLIKLPTVPARNNAYLYQRNGGELDRLQAVLVDDAGYAHFYLANVDSETDYFIGINVPEEQTESILIPQSMYPEFNIADTVEKIEYVVTGAKSSWGINLGQMTWIIAGVLVASVAIVGTILFAINKRKLRKGYIPDID